MSFDVIRATILFGRKPTNVKEIRLVFTKTNKGITKRNYIDSVMFPPLAKDGRGWFSTIIPVNPMGILTHIDTDTAYARINVYPKQVIKESIRLTLMVC